MKNFTFNLENNNEHMEMRVSSDSIEAAIESAYNDENVRRLDLSLKVQYVELIGLIGGNYDCAVHYNDLGEKEPNLYESYEEWEKEVTELSESFDHDLDLYCFPCHFENNILYVFDNTENLNVIYQVDVNDIDC